MSDGTLINAPLRADHTYTHGPSTGTLAAHAYPFHCSVHPRMTGTMILIE